MPDDSRALISSAFEAARKSGKPDWMRMTTAVLKNRLLSLTGGNFKEEEFGAPSMLQFARQHADLLEVDEKQFPPVVRLRTQDSTPNEPLATTKDRIRPDLWRAILDYSSGMSYVWDADKQVAEPSIADTDARKRLPTIDRETMARWRSEFATSLSPDDEVSKQRLRQWVDKELPTHFLPPQFKGQWNADLKSRVSKVIESWFSANAPAVGPATIVQARTDSVRLRRDDLANLITECISVMTENELSRIKLPASAVARVIRERERR